MKSYLALAIFASSAFCTHTALSQQPKRVDIPFSFMVKGQPFPSGNYSVETDINEAFIDLSSNLDPAKHIKLVAMPADPRHEFVVLTFSLEGSTHVLEAIQYARKVAKL
jgi:hypothetical protein